MTESTNEEQKQAKACESDENSKEINGLTEEAALLALPKHPLEHTWTLWYYENIKGKDWAECLREVTSFNTVEDFWCIFTNIKPASELKQSCDYNLFKKGIRPMWEDLQNKEGGRWLIPIDKKQRLSDLDKYWLEIILCLIGQDFKYADEVNGAVVNIRNKADKLSVWTANGQNREACLEIGRTLKDRLKIPPHEQIKYELHAQSMVRTGSVTKSLYSV